MTRTATLFAAGCLFAGSAAAQPSRIATDQLKDAVWARDVGAATITVDGSLSEPEWAQAEVLRLSQDGTQPVFLPGGGYGGRDTFNGQPAPDPGQALVYYLRKGNMLYIGTDVTDASIGGQRDIYEADGFVIALLDRTVRDAAFAMGNPVGDNYFAPGPREIIYNWANGDPMGQDTVGAFPTLKGNLTNPDDGIVSAATVFKAGSVSNDDRNRTGVFTPDQGYTMEIAVDLSKLGYDFTQANGDAATFNIAFYDRDNAWPTGQTNIYEGRAWLQGYFANAFLDGAAFIYGSPAVTTTSGALPATAGGDVNVPSVTAGSRLTVDGRLDESAWAAVQPAVVLKYKLSLDSLNALPSPQGPYFTSYFRPGGGDTAPPVVEPSTGSFKLLHRGNTLYIGLDTDDQAISGQTTNEDRYDGFRLIIRDATPDMGDNYVTGNRIPSRQFTMVMDSTGAVRLRESAASAPYVSGITARAFLKGAGTAGNGNDIDEGYQMEVAIDLTELGVDQTNGLIWIGIAYFDGDDLNEDVNSYGTRTWWLTERAQGPMARTYLDPTTMVGTAGESQPGETGLFRTLGAAPNPFGGRTALRYELAASSDVTVEVFDVLGRRVALVAAGQQAAGVQSVSFDASALTPGAYVYRVSAAGETATGRILVAR